MGNENKTQQTDEDDDEDFAKDPLFSMIVHDAATLGGKPRLAGRRISVQLIVRHFADGWDFEKVMHGYDLTREEITAALRYAAWKMGPTNPTK